VFRSDDITLMLCIGIVGTPVFAVSARIMLRAATDSLVRVRTASRPAAALPPPPAEVAAMQRELEDLRAEVERLKEAESFYAQLDAPRA
jgi:hypothetical protein